MEMKGSQTERNLLMAFAGESQARNRYTFFASQARTDGYMQIASIFEETANRRRTREAVLQVSPRRRRANSMPFPAGVVGPTAANLLAAADGEHEEWSDVYPGFAAVAREEGFPDRRRRPREDRRCRAAARAALPRAAGERQGGPGVQAGPKRQMAVPELRLRPRRPGGPGGLPRLRPIPRRTSSCWRKIR